MNLLELYRTSLQTLEAGETLATATVTNTQGATPQKAGAKMLILPGGRLVGTIGGGCIEAEVWQEAKRLIAEGSSSWQSFSLAADGSADSSMVCGGEMSVLIEVVPAGKRAAENRRLFAGIAEALEKNETVALFTVVQAGSGESCAGEKMLIWADGRSRGTLGTASLDQAAIACTAKCLARKEICLFRPHLGTLRENACESDTLLLMERIAPQPNLLIVGGGHVGQALARLGKMLDFHVTIVDNRESFLTRDRFPDADDLLYLNFEELSQQTTIDANTYVVIVTRGHEFDEIVLRQVLASPAAYIGMIGSRRRVALIKKRLTQDGFEAPHLAKIHAPIGLAMGAVTVEEIAVSIAAEIISVKRAKPDKKAGGKHGF